jgi:hypothetical protein
MQKKVRLLILILSLTQTINVFGFPNDSLFFRIKLFSMGRFIDNAIHLEDIYEYGLDTIIRFKPYSEIQYNSDKNKGQLISYYYKDTLVGNLIDSCQFNNNNYELVDFDSIDFTPVLLMIISNIHNNNFNDTIEIDSYKHIRLKFNKNLHLIGYSPIPYTQVGHLAKFVKMNDCLFLFILSMLPEDLKYNWKLSNEDAKN